MRYLGPSARVAGAVSAGLLVAGLVLLVLGAELAALATAGVGAVGLVALAFYAVGRSEDADRERGRS